ncbi:MAG TPA: hypothetical protein VK516_03915 [Gemmatimonadaceae bacterium]|nr:hypothetical protein [Gemmatimonadaceae bacterium]
MQRTQLAVAAAVLAWGCQPTAPSSPPAPVPSLAVPRVIPSPASLALSGGASFQLTKATGVTIVGSGPEVAAIGETLAALEALSSGSPATRPRSEMRTTG